MSKWNANREGYADNTASIAIQRVSKEERKNNMAKRSCRRTTDENAIHNKAVKIRTRTAIIVSHIETMFGLYDAYCEKSPNQDIDRRRYEVVWDKYMAEPVLTVKEIAAKHNMSKENVYSDLRVAEERLTALIFGVDGLKVR